MKFELTAQMFEKLVIRVISLLIALTVFCGLLVASYKSGKTEVTADAAQMASIQYKVGNIYDIAYTSEDGYVVTVVTAVTNNDTVQYHYYDVYVSDIDTYKIINSDVTIAIDESDIDYKNWKVVDIQF